MLVVVGVLNVAALVAQVEAEVVDLVVQMVYQELLILVVVGVQVAQEELE